AIHSYWYLLLVTLSYKLCLARGGVFFGPRGVLGARMAQQLKLPALEAAGAAMLMRMADRRLRYKDVLEGRIRSLEVKLASGCDSVAALKALTKAEELHQRAKRNWEAFDRLLGRVLGIKPSFGREDATGPDSRH